MDIEPQSSECSAATALAEPPPKNYLDSWHFQYPPRPVQVRILDFISSHPEENNFMVHAPCGVGKSPVTVTIANADSGVVVTPHKFLQDQYLKDWSDVALVKGRSNYTCQIGASLGASDCENGYKLGCKNQSCPYGIAKNAFNNARIGITNYDWLFRYIQSDQLINQKWLLFDEGHEFEPKLLEQAALVVTKKWADTRSLPYDTFKYQDEAEKWFKDVFYPQLKTLHAEVADQLDRQGDSKDVVLLQKFIDLEKVKGSADMYSMRSGDGEEWVYSSDTFQFSFKPLFATRLFDDYIKPLNKRHLFTSATLGPPKLLKKWLGIDSYQELDTPSPFSLESRKIHFIPTAYVTSKNLDESLVKVCHTIGKIMRKFSGEKGIIHTPSFALAEKIYHLLGRDPRILLHTKNNTREELLKKHTASPNPTILLSPSMTEGMDLVGNLSRFTVFPKLPYPYLGDPWVVRRKDADPSWYAWQVAKTIMQGMGRSVRGPEDYATGYILDSCFERFYSDNSWMFPKWFQDSFV